MDNGATDVKTYYSRPDIAVRNTMRAQLGRMPTKEEVRREMGLPENQPVRSPVRKQTRQRRVKKLSAKAAAKLGPEYVNLNVLQKISGISRDTWASRIRSGKIDAYWMPGPTLKGRYLVNQAVLNPLKQSPANREKTVTVKRKSPAKRKLRKRVKTVTLASEPTTVNDVLQNHISYAYGHCMAWLENYASGSGLSPRSLVGAVGDLLRLGVK